MNIRIDGNPRVLMDEAYCAHCGKWTVEYYQRRRDHSFVVPLAMDYSEACDLARRRAKDGRYRNYEFYLIPR